MLHLKKYIQERDVRGLGHSCVIFLKENLGMKGYSILTKTTCIRLEEI